MRDCYATGSFGGDQSGGLVSDNNGLIQTSFSIGRAISRFKRRGGLIGVDHQPVGSLSNTYWDLDTSGISDPSQGAASPQNDPGITGVTDEQLKSALPKGFNKKIWAQNPTINNGYPYLIANPPSK